MKLEEILEQKLPVHVNQNAENEGDKIFVSVKSKEDFLNLFKEKDRFNIFDYLELESKIDLSGAHQYWMVDSEGAPTLSLIKAVQVMPNLGIPYIELNISSDTGVPFEVIITYERDDKLLFYIPRKGNTIRLDNNETIGDSGLFNFDWKNKTILEGSDLLYIVKDINRPALSKYRLEDIYNAFQDMKESTNIVEIDRKSCILELEKFIVLE